MEAALASTILGTAPGAATSATLIAPSARVATPGTDVRSPVDEDRATRWWVLHARPRTEKALAERLAVAGLDYYLPLVTVRHTYAKSKVAFHKPLFPGYLFLRGTAEARLAALQTNRVVSAIRVADQDQLERELAQIRAAIGAGAPLELYPTISVGTRCRVAGGPLRGIEGVVAAEASGSRLYLNVTVLGQSAVLEIDVALLERLG